MYTYVYMTRHSFGEFAKMASANPFGEERLALERRIGKAPTNAARDEVFERCLTSVSSALGKGLYGRATQGERDAIERAIAFVVIHRFSREIDKHIEAQLESARPIRPSFAKSVLSALDAYGIKGLRALEHIPLLFQLRRAYVFIDRSVTGESRPIQGLREALWNNIFTHDLKRYAETLTRRMEDFSTILLGETGTGKGAAAAAIGMSGYIPWNEHSGMFRETFAATFVPLNLSEYAESLIESELFGHEKGAFTGALQPRKGAFERCSEFGSVFLDEIGDLDPAIQVKLLRVLEARQFTPVGGTEARRFAGRTIAATHRSLEELRESGRMRSDFYYRLCSDVIRMPSLRERIDAHPGELRILLDRIVTRVLGESSPSVAEQTERVIARSLPENYAWPGNIRELQQCVRRVLLTSTYEGDPLVKGVRGTAQSRHQAVLRDRARALYLSTGNYGAVARAMGIDRRTAKKYAH